MEKESYTIVQVLNSKTANKEIMNDYTCTCSCGCQNPADDYVCQNCKIGMCKVGMKRQFHNHLGKVYFDFELILNKMNLEVESEKKAEIEKVITSEDSPVGIDAKKTHVIIINKLVEIEKRLIALEKMH